MAGASATAAGPLSIVFLDIVMNAWLCLVGPGEVKVAKRCDLVQADPPFAVELKHRQEPRHYLVSAAAVGDQLAERRAPH